MSVGDIFLLAAVCLWAVWAVFVFVRRYVDGKGCCASCSGGCPHCLGGKHEPKQGRKGR